MREVQEKKATIKDVAARAQTSVATVSRVLSNADYPVSAALRQRVEEAARALSFVTGTSRQKRMVTKQTVGLIIPNLSNPYYVQTIQGISSVCYDQGYGLLLCDTQNDLQKEQRFLQDLYTSRVNGVILSSLGEDKDFLADFVERGMLIIQLDQRFAPDGGYSINFDSKRGAQMAVRCLQEKGHTRIAFASTPITRWTRKQIYKGYLEQMKNAGLQIDDDRIFVSQQLAASSEGSPEVQAGLDIARQIVASQCGITAVFCVNDMLAFGLIRGLHDQGIRVPEDISVVGFDDIPLSSALVPSLTTIHCSSYETGRFSAMMLLDQVRNRGAVGTTHFPITMNLQPVLIERDSVADIRA